MTIPKYARQADWPRRVASAINALEVQTKWSLLSDYADDTAAAAGGVAVGNLYRTGSIIKVRVS